MEELTRIENMALSSGVAAVAIAVATPAAANAADVVRLSDERTVTRSAYAEYPAWVRKGPRYGSGKLARLRPTTYHGSPETVLVLARTERAGLSWSFVRFPGLGVRRGWIPSVALSPPRLHRTRLVLDRRRLRIRVYRRGRPVLTAPVGVGAASSPTPKGRYYIRERIVPVAKNTVYGVLAFGTSAYSRYRTDWPGGGQVGIHGTNQPGLIPGWISNGCVRVRNRDVRRLDRLMRVGAPLLVK